MRPVYTEGVAAHCCALVPLSSTLGQLFPVVQAYLKLVLPKLMHSQQ
jgi:hypothetical protein